MKNFQIIINNCIALFLALFLFTSCSNKEEIVEYYNDGSLKTIYIFRNGIKQDSSIHFYEGNGEKIKAIKYWKDDNAFYQKDFSEDGKLMQEGKLLKDNFRIGKWDLYSDENYKSEVIEYLNIKGSSYANQIWKLNKTGDTIVGGIYYELIRKDTANHSEPYRIHFFLKQRILLNSESFVYLPSDEYVCKEDFSNENKIKWKKIDNVARWNKNFPDRKHDIILSFWIKKTSRDTLRGYIIEKDVSETDYDSITRKTYFNIPYFVK